MAEKYEHLDIPLGQGSYGYVSQYRVKETNIFVAVKTIDVSHMKKERWQREIKVWQQIRPHENVVPLLDHWMIKKNIRAVMPLARFNLSEYVRERRIEKEEKGTLLDSQILVEMSLMLLEGTSHLHNSKPPIIHRDLKPANILCFGGENDRIILKIADFGISKFQNHEQSTHHTTRQGTKKFQAPEVIKGDTYTIAVDVWSLGVVLFYLTTGGELPYFTEIEDWNQQTIDYDDLWKISNSFFELDDRTAKGIEDVINQMIVLEKRTRISIDAAREKIKILKHQTPLEETCQEKDLNVRVNLTESISSQQQPPFIVLSSTGPSAEYHGGSLGMYKYVQDYNNSPAYRQRHTVAGTLPWCLYRNEDGDWGVGRELGGSDCDLLNRTRRDSVPTNNWLYEDSTFKWQSDPSLTVTTSLPSVCGVIRISLHGAAARVQAETGGEYRATGDWRAGRPVFSNGVRYLSVRPGGSEWCVTDTPDSSWPRLRSNCATWCPASPRAAVSHRENLSSWRFGNKYGYHDGDIRLTCDSHQH